MEKTFQTIWKLSWPSGNYPDHSENIKIIRKLSRLSGNFPGYPEIFQCNFKGYVQKLSGWQCHHATRVFGPLGSLIRACAYNMSSPVSEIWLDWSGLMIHPKMNPWTLRLFNPLYVTTFKMFFFFVKKYISVTNTNVHNISNAKKLNYFQQIFAKIITTQFFCKTMPKLLAKDKWHTAFCTIFLRFTKIFCK